MSTLKVDTITTISGTGNINLSRPIAGDGSNLTGVAPTKTTIEALGIDVPAANLTGTVADARFPATLPASSGVNLTALNASEITSGTLPAGRYTDTTYSVQDGELSENSFTDADHTKLNGIEASADVTDATNVASAGAGMLTVDQAWTGSQRATLVTDNDGNFDLNAGQNFKCTPTAGLTLTFTNFANGQSGFIILVNSGGHAIARHGDTIADANFVATVSTAGTYIISYISDGTDAFLTNSAIMA